VTPFQRMFGEQYDVIHRLETNKLRNVAKLFAHLLHTDAISWEVCLAVNIICCKYLFLSHFHVVLTSQLKIIVQPV